MQTQIPKDTRAMKKIITLLAASISLPALSQKIVYEDTSIDVIPRHFTTEGKPILHFADNNGEFPVISLYNDDIEKINEVQLKEHSFDYTLTYRDETREVKEVTKTELYREHYRDLNESYTFDDFFIEQTYYGPHEMRIENGDTIIFSTQYDPYITTRMSPMDRMFFGFDYFGTKYPISYLLCKNSVIYQVRAEYTATYTDWVSTGERKEECSIDVPIVTLSYNNMDEIGDETDFILSQTLFNDDDKFEYIIPKATLTDVSSLVEMQPNPNTLVLSRSTLISDYAYPAYRGIQIVSSDGTVLHDLDFGNDFEMNEYNAEWMSVITIGGKTYLLAQGYTRDDDGSNKDCTMFYRIDKQTNSVYQATAAPISMNIQQKSSTINVQLSNTSEASEIIISNAAGATVANQYVPAGENNATIRTRVSQGVYNITRLQNGKNVENLKFLVK